MTATRVWDRFLTDADRAHLARARDRRVGVGQRPALLMVDLYRGVFGDREQDLLEAVKTWPAACGPVAWQTLPRLARLLDAARAAGLPVVHVTGLDERDCGMLGWNEAIHGGVGRTTRDGSSGSEAEQDQRRRRYDIMPEVAPAPGEAVFRKNGPSAFWGTPLVGHLVQHHVDSLIVAGESTSGCVRASVVDAASYRLRVTVVEDCVFDRHEATHAINLFDMHQKYADVRPLDEVLPLIAGSQATTLATSRRGAA